VNQSIHQPLTLKSPDSGPERLSYSIKEAAELIGVSYHTVWRLVQRGDIKTCKGVPGKALISRAELLRFLDVPNKRKKRKSASKVDAFGDFLYNLIVEFSKNGGSSCLRKTHLANRFFGMLVA